MQFHESVSKSHQKKIKEALDVIAKQGISLSLRIAKLLQNNDIEIFTGSVNEIGGSGCLFIKNSAEAQKHIDDGLVSHKDSAKLFRLCIAEEIIEIGGQQQLEITLIHESKHALDFAEMLKTFSLGDEKKLYNPTKFQHEFSAYLTSAFYALNCGQTYTNTGLKLGLLGQNNERTYVDSNRILTYLREKYGLSFDKQSYRLSEISDNLKPKKV